jgi:MYXO-CTERM domain-containing protein
MLRFKWTAPVVAPGTVWFNVGFVNSNDDALPGGDGVTLVAMPLPPSGTALATRTVTQGSCSAARAASADASPLAIAFVLLVALAALRRRSMTSRTSWWSVGRRGA